MGLWLLAASLWPGPALADLPHPSFRYYGEILSAYGRPLVQNDQAQLILRVNGVECGRTRVQEGLGPAINYRVEVPLDDGHDQHYATYAARTNDRPQFVLLVGRQEYQLIDLALVIPVGAPGAMARLDLVQDTDADGDGLPDTWEMMIMAASNGRFTDLHQVRPQDDFDGDGFNNLQEFIAGTDPTWEVDFPSFEKWWLDRGGHALWFSYYSVPGKTYDLLGSTQLGGSAMWQSVPFAPASATAAFVTYTRGDGYLNRLWVPLGTNLFTGFRLRVR